MIVGGLLFSLFSTVKMECEYTPRTSFNCRNKAEYPLNVNCKVEGVVYRARVKHEKDNEKYILDPRREYLEEVV